MGMNHTDHVNLLRPASLTPSGTWADFGGLGRLHTCPAFRLVGPHANIYAWIRIKELSELEQAHRERFTTSQNIHTIRADFSGMLSCLRWMGS